MDAAILLGQVQQDPNNALPLRELAQYDLAVSLYNLKLTQASYGVFSDIADQPKHSKHAATLSWLGRLALDLPEPADVAERVGKYDEAAVDALQSGSGSGSGSGSASSRGRELGSQLFWMLGRYKYRNRQFDDARRVLAKVERSSPHWAKAQYLIGLAHIQLRQPVPAVQSFQRITQAEPANDDDERMHDLANLSIGRTYYSAAIRVDANRAPIADADKLAVAIKYWNKVGAGGEYWLDAQLGEAWAHVMRGDYSRALGTIHTIEAPYFAERAPSPEATLLKADIYFLTCHFGEADAVLFGFANKLQGVRDDLARLGARFREADEDSTRLQGKDETSSYDLLKMIRDGKARLPSRSVRVIERTLSDRDLRRAMQYVEELEDEDRRLARMPPHFRTSTLGVTVRERIQLTRDIALRNVMQSAFEKATRQVHDLDSHLTTGTQMLAEISVARRVVRPPTTKRAAVQMKAVITDDEEHEVWPFDGEYWLDELGSYRAVIPPQCPR
jgi:tetratricopeptide (TPR) repeat protein